MKLNDLAQRVRSHPGIAGGAFAGLAPEDFDYAVAQVVISVLQDIGETVGRSLGTKRHYTFTDPATVTIALGVDGSADLTALIASSGLLLENLKYGEIRHPDSAFPLVPCGSSAEGSLPGNFDLIFLHYWLVGRSICTRSADANTTPLTGSLSFACPRVNGLDDISPQLEDDVVDAVVLRLKGSTLVAAPKLQVSGSPE